MDIKKILNSQLKFIIFDTPKGAVIVFVVIIVAALIATQYYGILDFKTFFLSIVASLCATIVLSFLIPIQEHYKIKEIANLTQKDFMIKLFQNLQDLHRHYCEDWYVNIKLEKYDEQTMNDFYYKTYIDYNYKKNITNRYIKMVFYRIRNDDEYKTIPGKLDLVNENEFFWILDERDFKLEIDEKYFSVKNLFIDNQHIELDKNTFENTIVFEARIPSIEKLSIEKMRQINYSISMPHEKEDCVVLSLDVPTKNISISFDAKTVENEVITYAYESSSFTNKPLKEKIDGIWKIIDHDWMMHKNNFIFIWWKNNV